MKTDFIEKYLEGTTGKRVLIVGDLILDRYLWGKVNRISPEAPVPVVDIYKEESRLGGAANVALNVKALGMQPILCGVLGNGEAANLFLKIAEETGINTSLILKTENRRTTIKTRVIGNHQQMLRIDKEDKAYLEEDLEEQLLNNVKSLLNATRIDGIILEDYNKGVLKPTVIRKIILRASENNIPVFVDPKFENFFEYAGSTVFKPNIKELGQALGRSVSKENLEELRAAMTELRKKMPHQITLVTLSENGIALIDENESFIHIPAHYRSVVDVSGAGDTVISVAASGIIAGLPTKIAMHLGNLAGGLVCEELGVVPINKEKLIKEIREKGKELVR